MTAKKIKLSLSNAQKRKSIDPLKKYEASIKSQQTRTVYTITFRVIQNSIVYNSRIISIPENFDSLIVVYISLLFHKKSSI
jgi:hypothetical protein